MNNMEEQLLLTNKRENALCPILILKDNIILWCFIFLVNNFPEMGIGKMTGKINYMVFKKKNLFHDYGQSSYIVNNTLHSNKTQISFANSTKRPRAIQSVAFTNIFSLLFISFTAEISFAFHCSEKWKLL